MSCKYHLPLKAVLGDSQQK